MAVPRKPRLVFQSTIQRRPFFRRFAWAVLATVAAAAATLALDYSAGRGLLDVGLARVGRAAGLLAAALFGLRALANLWRGLRRRDEDLRFFDKGFVWARGQEQHKYGWSQLAVYREGGRGLYIGRRPLAQWGGHTLIMQDGRRFKVTGVYGDLREFARAVGRYAANATGTRLARTLREEKPSRLHPKLTVWPGGIEAGGQEIPWAKVDVRLKNGWLVISRRAESGAFRVVRRYNVHNVNNVGGLMELVAATIPNYQPERLKKRDAIRE
ncbi:MAG: hypothetical protein HXY41_18100 [Chloroflexi bacterium]|nr:hypothetical protein [Chloroflexota bacterium]